MRDLRRPRPIDSDVERPQLATEILLHLFAIGVVLALARLLMRAMGITEWLWLGARIYRFTDPLVWPLNNLPGAGRALIGDATLPDVTLVALFLLVPLGLMARSPRRDGS